jgi:hypothetical protein
MEELPTYALEKFGVAVQELIVRNENIRGRLGYALTAIAPLLEDDIPAELMEEYTRIRQYNVKGERPSIMDRIRGMHNKKATILAAMIWEFYQKIDTYINNQ